MQISCTSRHLSGLIRVMQAVAQNEETKKWDVFGISLSVLCAIHCLSVPFLIGILPLVGMDFMANHEFEWVMMGLIFLVAAVSYYNGYQKHRRLVVFCFLLVGVLVFAGLRPFLPEEWHAVATLVGGSVFGVGHWKNWHWHRSNCGKPCCSDSSHS